MLDFLRGAALALLLASRASAYDPVEKSIGELQAELAAGRTTSVELVQFYQQRIAKLNLELHAVIAVNPGALEEAQAMDAARRKSRSGLGPLAGIPILIKDNIESKDEMATDRRFIDTEEQRNPSRCAFGGAAADRRRDHFGQDQSVGMGQYSFIAFDFRLERGGRSGA